MASPMGRLVRELTFVFPLLALPLGGCYYAQLAAGQLRVLAARVPVVEAAADPHGRLAPEQRRLLSRVPEMLRYAKRVVRLRVGGAYRSFVDTGARPVSYNVSACERTAFRRVRWWYPLVGRLPYRGYFDLEAARKEAARWRARGLDARVSGVRAYSTLGWFDDPIFRGMLRDGEPQFAITLFHELAHRTLFRKGDAVFSESLATFVGERAALAWLAYVYGERAPVVARARAEIEDARVVATFMRALYVRLAALYDARGDKRHKLAERERIFARARAELRALERGQLRTGLYRGLWRTRFDNCLVLGFQTYNTEQARFAEVFARVGGDWARFWRVVEQAAACEAPFVWLRRWCARAQRGARANSGWALSHAAHRAASAPKR